jgi:hypothetical protein
MTDAYWRIQWAIAVGRYEPQRALLDAQAALK